MHVAMAKVLFSGGFTEFQATGPRAFRTKKSLGQSYCMNVSSQAKKTFGSLNISQGR